MAKQIIGQSLDWWVYCNGGRHRQRCFPFSFWDRP